MKFKVGDKVIAVRDLSNKENDETMTPTALEFISSKSILTVTRISYPNDFPIYCTFKEHTEQFIDSELEMYKPVPRPKKIKAWRF